MMVKIDEEAENKEIIRQYRSLLRVADRVKKRKDKKLIRKAFEMAVEAHKNVRRKSGEPYIFHPMAVANIVGQEMGLDSISIVCALLHDTVEDTKITLDDIEKQFGKEARNIIDGLTKISGVIENTDSMQAENFRKILITLSDDVRVILIKLADRLHNMRTLDAMKGRKQLKIANETSFLYAPLAHRLGLYSIKTELEDLALKYTNPDVYEAIRAKLKKTKEVRERFIKHFAAPIGKALKAQNFKYEMKSRTKSISSILDKMNKKDIPFEEVYDVFALRIIVQSKPDREKADCWRIYSTVTDSYKPNPNRLRDWISTPKLNGYESLHTTVMSPTGKWVEVQIRTKRMDEIAEKGYAAHWRYKEGLKENNIDVWLNKIRGLIEDPDSNAVNFVDEFRLNLFKDEVFVFTPQGDIKNLPVNATALDFAFEIHTDIGLTCTGAMVDNDLKPLNYKLSNGDQIEIITSSKQIPSRDWLDFVVTSKAKSNINSAFKKEEKEIAERGKEKLERKLKHYKIPYNQANINIIQQIFDTKNEHDLYYVIATNNKLDLSVLKAFELNNGVLQTKMKVKKAKVSTNKKKKKTTTGSKEKTIIIGEDEDKFDYELATCCNPLKGDKIFGFVTINDGIKIHKTSCTNAKHMLGKYAYRFIAARWSDQKKNTYLTGIKITGIDEVGLVNKITRIISTELNFNMNSISFRSKDGIFEGEIMAFLDDINRLEDLIKKLKKETEIINISRIESN